MGTLSISEIMQDLEVINQQISAAVAEFNTWLDECREKEMSDEDILAEINGEWSFSSFGSLEEAIEWFENLGI